MNNNANVETPPLSFLADSSFRPSAFPLHPHFGSAYSRVSASDDNFLCGGVIWQCRLSKSTGSLSWAPFLFGEQFRIQGLFQAMGRNLLTYYSRGHPPQRPHTTHDTLKSIPDPPDTAVWTLQRPTFWQSDFGLQITQHLEEEKKTTKKKEQKRIIFTS